MCPKVITSSIDRSVKVWNLNNIFEQVHVIDRHELQIDSIRYRFMVAFHFNDSNSGFKLLSNPRSGRHCDSRMCWNLEHIDWKTVGQTCLQHARCHCNKCQDHNGRKVLHKTIPATFNRIKSLSFVHPNRYIIAAESGSIIIWEWPSRRVLFRDEQPSIKQIMFMENDSRFCAVSCLGTSPEGRVVLVVR